MAKNILPTNYQDDIMNESAGGKRKYRMIHNEDGTVSFDDLTVYDLEGSDYGAGDINRTNEAVNQSLDKAKVIDDINAIGAITQEGYAMGALAGKAINDSLQADNGQSFQFAYDSASGKYGYKAEVEGADTFFPFKTTEVVYLGSGTSFNVSSYKGYENFTADNFIVQMNNLSNWNSQYNSDISGSGTYFFSKVSISLGKSYNANTGVLSAYYSISNNYGAHMASPPSTTSSGTIAVSAWLILK